MRRTVLAGLVSGAALVVLAALGTPAGASQVGSGLWSDTDITLWPAVRAGPGTERR